MSHEQPTFRGAPVTGFGQTDIASTPKTIPSAWTVALATSVVGAATGWVIEEVAQTVRKRRKKRR